MVRHRVDLIFVETSFSKLVRVAAAATNTDGRGWFGGEVERKVGHTHRRRGGNLLLPPPA